MQNRISKMLKKEKFIAKQLSKRQGELYCRLIGERVHISGSAVLYLKGTIYI